MEILYNNAGDIDKALKTLGKWKEEKEAYIIERKSEIQKLNSDLFELHLKKDIYNAAKITNPQIESDEVKIRGKIISLTTEINNYGNSDNGKILHSINQYIEHYKSILKKIRSSK